MNRRSFLSLIGACVMVAVDPERLLWTPGRKLISVPKPLAPFNLGVDSIAYHTEFADLKCYIRPAIICIAERLRHTGIKRFNTVSLPAPAEADQFDTKSYPALGVFEDLPLLSNIRHIRVDNPVQGRKVDRVDVLIRPY